MPNSGSPITRRERSPDYFDLISKFEERTGCPLVVNTSFNVRGEPVVCTPEDAYRCFSVTEMDVLVMGRYVLVKSEQDELASDARESHLAQFQLD